MEKKQTPGQDEKKKRKKSKNLKYQPQKPQSRLFWFHISLPQQSTFNILIILPLFPQLSISTALAL